MRGEERLIFDWVFVSDTAIVSAPVAKSFRGALAVIVFCLPFSTKSASSFVDTEVASAF